MDFVLTYPVIATKAKVDSHFSFVLRRHYERDEKSQGNPTIQHPTLSATSPSRVGPDARKPDDPLQLYLTYRFILQNLLQPFESLDMFCFRLQF